MDASYLDEYKLTEILQKLFNISEQSVKYNTPCPVVYLTDSDFEDPVDIDVDELILNAAKRISRK